MQDSFLQRNCIVIKLESPKVDRKSMEKETQFRPSVLGKETWYYNWWPILIFAMRPPLFYVRHWGNNHYFLTYLQSQPWMISGAHFIKCCTLLSLVLTWKRNRYTKLVLMNHSNNQTEKSNNQTTHQCYLLSIHYGKVTSNQLSRA